MSLDRPELLDLSAGDDPGDGFLRDHTDEGVPSAPVPRAVITAAGILALLGLGISLYLTIAHFLGTGALVCSDSGVVDCAKVTTSAQSHILGVPVAVLGLGFFLVDLVFNLPWSWRSPVRTVHLVRVGLAVCGMLFVLWLISAELLIIHNICLWCSGVHLVTFCLFVLNLATAAVALAGAPRGGSRSDG